MSKRRETTKLEFDHGSVSVGDIEDAVRFYRDLLGLKQVPRPDFGFAGAWFMAGGVPVHLTTGGFTQGPGRPLRPNDSHLAFRVASGLDDLIDELRSRAVPVFELENSPAAERQIFLHDPWGNVIELCRYAPRR